MALATSLLPTSDPAGHQPGLSSRMASISEALAALLADLDPDTLVGPDAAILYAAFAKVERLGVAGKTLLAPRIAASGHWEAEGHRSPAGLLATLEGGSAGQAKRTLETGQQLGGLPSVEAALRQGRLSGPKAAEITDAATLDPRAETDLLAGSEHESLQATKERCQRSRATSTRHDPLAGAQRVHAKRHFSHWTDAEGAFCYQGSDTPERGAALLARLLPAVTRLRSARRGDTTDPPGAGVRSGPPHEASLHEPLPHEPLPHESRPSRCWPATARSPRLGSTSTWEATGWPTSIAGPPRPSTPRPRWGCPNERHLSSPVPG